MSSAVWLENDVFYFVYTPTVASEDDRPSSSYYIITRQRPDIFTFNQLPEVCSPFGLERYPPYQFTARLRSFDPDLKEVLVIASTASTDVGLFTKSSKHFGTSAQGQTAGVFTATEMLEDSRRAVLPMTEDMLDTTAIGLALDLSSKEEVPAPIRGEDIDSSGHPLPQILILNHEGVLSSWWFVYSDSIRQGKPYQGLGGAPAPSQPIAQKQISSSIAPPPETPKPAFGKPAFGQPSFGTPSALGASRAQPAFGSPSALGSSQQASTTPAGPAFGAPSMLGQRGPTFGQSTPIQAFGQSSALGGFGSPSGAPSATVPPAGGGFSSFASASGAGFASLSKTTSSASPFASGASPFANAGQSFASGAAASTQKEGGTTGNFGLGSTGFKLGSTFKPDASAAANEERPAEPSGGLSLGPSFGNLLSDTMATDQKVTSPPAQEPAPAPAFGKSPSPFGLPQEQPKPTEMANPFGPQPTETTPASSFAQVSPFAALKGPSTPSTAPSLISQPSLSDSTVKVETPSAAESTPAPEPPLPPDPTSKAVYAPGDTSASSTNSFEEAPLPPDFTTSKPKPAHGEAPLPPDFINEKPKAAEEAPLPPDFLQEQPKPAADEAPLSPDAKEKPKPAPEEAPLPPDFLPKKPEATEEEEVPVPDESEGEDEFEDSGEEVEDSGEEIEDSGEEVEDSGEEVTNEGHHVESFKSFTSPESSFGGPGDHSPTPNIFSKMPSEQEKKQDHAKQLFGEIPKFPPPKGPDGRRQPLSPRSPSPVRAQRARNLQRPDGMRSISAPSVPGQVLSQRKATLEKSRLANQVHLTEDESPDEDFVERTKKEEPLELVEDEDEQLRADLQRPISPVPTLDPFLPHQDYTGESFKAGVPGQIERLYRDINAMIDTLGINSRSLSSYLLFQESNKDTDYKRWMRTLESDKAGKLLDEKVLLAEIDKLPLGVQTLESALQKGQVHGIQDKVSRCHQLLTRDVATLRGQCANMRRTIDAHVDEIAIASAPLSAEQLSLQQDLRQSYTEMQSKLTDLERDITQLRAGLADASQPDSTPSGGRTGRPTVEAVTSTINTMTSMAEKKSGDIDVLEAQMRKLGLDLAASVISSPGRHVDAASPFHTPQRKMARFPLTPGSRDTDTMPRTTYHTPESTGRFRSSLLGRSPINGTPSRTVASPEDATRWKSKSQRRMELTEHVRSALENRQVKVRGLD